MSGPGVVVVGTSFGCLTHIRALRAAGFEVVGLVGRDPQRTAARAERFGIPHATSSLTTALDLPGVDAVTIATPPHTHAPLALEAIAAGKHVLCEKPFTRDAAEARALLTAAERAGIVHLLGTEFRWATWQALMTRVVHDGAIGEPRMATFVLTISLLANPNADVPEWWSDGAQGGGWLGAHASHVIDQVQTTLGAFEGVSAVLPNLVERGWTAEDSYVVHFRTTNGCAGTLLSSAADYGPIQMVARVAGTAGTAWVEGERVRIADAAGTRDVPIPDDLVVPPAAPPDGDLLTSAYDLLHATGIDFGPYTRLTEVFRRLIEGEPVPPDPSPATFVDGLAGMEVLDAIRAAARSGSWVACGG